MNLTARQHEIIKYIWKYRKRRGLAPTLAEIASELGISKVTVHEHIAQLEKKGALEKEPFLSRSTRLTRRMLRELERTLEEQSRYVGVEDGSGVRVALEEGAEPVEVAAEPVAEVRASLSMLPLLGEIAAGKPLEAVEERELVDLSDICQLDRANYLLRVKGDSMIDDGIRDGDNIENVVVHLEKIPIPVIFTDTSADMHDLTIVNNNYQGGKIATRSLLQGSRGSVGLITGPLSYFSARERQRGWRDALSEASLPCDDEWIVEGDWTPSSGAAALEVLLQRHPNLSAIFACNDQMALGVLYAAEQKGLVVPRDLALVGYDDIPEAAFFHPPLSSVHQDVVDLGSLAVSQLVRAIDLLAIRGSYTPETMTIEPELIIRTSSGCG